ncbi:MAG: efflux RND transporter periplasmic adaptor subunit [Hyphomicrobiaceae bacterium]
MKSSFEHRVVWRGLVLALAGQIALAAGTPAYAQGASAAPAPVAPAGQPAPEAQAGWLQRQWAALMALAQSPASTGTSATAPKAPAGPPPAVTVSRPLVRNVIEWDEYTGRFDAVDAVDVRARVSSYLVDIHFKDGQLVKKGDLLFTIDPRPFERAVDQARAELDQWQTRVRNASKDVSRALPLVKQGVVSEKNYDDRENAFEDAVAAAKVAEARLRTAELELSFTKVTSSIDGRVSRANVSIGSYIVGNNASGTQLTNIVSQDPILIYFDVNENNYIKYKRLQIAGATAVASELGTAVEIALPDDSGFPHKGRLDFIDNRLDSSTGTLRARATIANKAGLFSAGMFARVRVPGSPEYSAVLLPDEAIGTDQTNRFVLVVDADGVASRRTVGLGRLQDGLRVIKSGVTADDWVVVRGIQRARPGQKVTPKREPLQVSAVSAAPGGSAQ